MIKRSNPLAKAMEICKSIDWETKGKRNMPPVTAKPTAATIAEPTVPPKMPDLSDSPAYVKAVANLRRLQAEVARLEAAQLDYSQQQAAIIDAKARAIRSIVDGGSIADARPRVVDQDVAQLQTDLYLARRAVDVAQAEVRRVASDVRAEVAAPFVAHFRAKVRAAAVAMIEAAKRMTEVDRLAMELSNRNLLSQMGCELPTCPWGDVGMDGSPFGWIVRRLLEDSILSEKDDAAILDGLKPDPKPAPYVPPTPTPAKKEKRGLARVLDGWVG